MSTRRRLMILATAAAVAIPAALVLARAGSDDASQNAPSGGSLALTSDPSMAMSRPAGMALAHAPGDQPSEASASAFRLPLGSGQVVIALEFEGGTRPRETTLGTVRRRTTHQNRERRQSQ